MLHVQHTVMSMLIKKSVAFNFLFQVAIHLYQHNQAIFASVFLALLNVLSKQEHMYCVIIEY